MLAAALLAAAVLMAAAPGALGCAQVSVVAGANLNNLETPTLAPDGSYARYAVSRPAAPCMHARIACMHATRVWMHAACILRSEHDGVLACSPSFRLH